MKLKLTGKVFGKLTAISEHGADNHGRSIWMWKCKCGNKKAIRVHSVTSGNTTSCGCFALMVRRKIPFIHGMTGSSEYRIWSAMKRRCYNKNVKQYKYYGGRGISVCKRWRNSFQNFYSDMGPRPDGLCLERKNNNGNYSPSNCMWATMTQQSNNTSRNSIYTVGNTSLTLSEWCKKGVVRYPTLWWRITRGGWPMEMALNRPAGGRNLKNAN